MTDDYSDSRDSLESPAEKAYSVTPNDTTDLPFATRAFYIGGEGNIKVDTVGGNTVTLIACPAGSYHPIRVKRVYATGTTATNIVALY